MGIIRSIHRRGTGTRRTDNFKVDKNLTTASCMIVRIVIKLMYIRIAKMRKKYLILTLFVMYCEYT